MDIDGSVALVTGSNRGLGRHFAEQLLERGARTVYATSRNPESVDLPGVVPVQLDITDPASIARAVGLVSDTTLLINNAGISTHATLMDGDFDEIRREMETHFFGTLAATRAFAPVIAGNGGGAILNVLSVLSWLHVPSYGAYCAAKAASWAMTDVVRQELAPKGIQVSALHVGYMNTDMAHYVEDDNKVDAATVAAEALDGIQAGLPEILADDKSRAAKQALSASPPA